MSDFSHFDKQGNAIMVDVSDKAITTRVAVASGAISMSAQALAAVLGGTVKKGDVLGVARVAGIMAIKQTATLIPMCHPLLVSGSSIDFEIDQEANVIKAVCTVKISGQTGVEMEALTGVSTALLTIYDMCKALDKSQVIHSIMLEEKTGGKSDDYARDARSV